MNAAAHIPTRQRGSRELALSTIATIGLTATLACGGETSVDPSLQPAPTAIQLTPSQSIVGVGQNAVIGASVAAAELTWVVNGITGGDTIVGKIDANGRYTAPSFVPASNPVRIMASLKSAPSTSGVATVIVTPAPTQGLWVTSQPRVLNTTATGNVVVVANASAGTTRVEFVSADGSSTVQFTNLSGTLFQGAIPASRMLRNYQTGDLHAVAGFIDLYSGATRTSRLNLSSNVRDASVPDVATTPVAADVQRAAHVVNIRYDSLFLGGGIPTAIPRRFYQAFGDDYDFLGVIEQVNVVANRNYQSVKNSETGFGASQFDRSATVGSSGHLLGMIDYPTSTFFDLGETGSVHEIGHRWLVYLPGSFASGAHWPMSDVAYGIMGYSLPGGEGGQFSFTLTAVGSDYAVHQATPATRFNDLELYLMGLAPASEVGAHFVFQNQNQTSEMRDGGLLRGPVTPLGINDVIAAVGPRVPAFGLAKTSFGMATVVLSYGRLLSREEMAFFDFMAARGEATTPLRFTSGLAAGTSLPFALATNGRGTLSTAIR